jgi:GDP-mannose 6-dehydrogenase
MNISVFGLGYVGAVTAACLARHGHRVVGVDVHPLKVEMFNQGQPPIVEPGLAELLQAARERGAIEATADCATAVRQSELSILCVGTPSTVAGALDLACVRQVLREIRTALEAEPKPHVLVLRSTMLPGSTRGLMEAEGLMELLEAGALQVFYFPEFLREGTAVGDFDDPSLAVVGTVDGGPPPAALRTALFGERTDAVDWATAELVKYACNAFHATKVAFANEMGRVAGPLGIDARRVMELLCQDRRLNLSPYYLRPGNPFGGSCLPKDVRALAQLGRQQGLQLPLLESLLPSNEKHLQTLLARIAGTGCSEVVILGLSFKLQTDDLRESAMVEVAQTLLGRGYTVRIYDPQLNLARLMGSNKRMVDARMPHLASLLKEDLREALGGGGLVVAAQRCAPVAELAGCLTARHRLLDVNSWPELQSLDVPYEGFCW